MRVFLLFALALTLASSGAAQEASGRFSPHTARVLQEAMVSGKQGTERVGAIVYTTDEAALEALGLRVQARYDGFVTVYGSASALVEAAALPQVSYVDAASYSEKENDGSAALVGAKALHQGALNNTSYRGRGVLVCVIDSGIDWQHGDFREAANPTTSRIVSIWDQTLTAQAGEAPPSSHGFTYGVEYTRAQIEAALAGGTVLRTRDTDGHGTHVAGTAAGNGASLTPAQHVGMAPEAELVIIKAGDGSYPTSNVVDGISYCDKVATAQGKPAVVNMSLGSQFGAHDGTDAKSVASTTFGTKAGRVAVLSAGNDGGDNIHISGTLGVGATATYTFVVPTYTPKAGANNDEFTFDLWFDGISSVTATMTPATGTPVTQASGSQQTHATPHGSIYLFNFNDSSNGQRRVYASVEDANAAEAPTRGAWTLRVTNTGGEAMNYHGWVVNSSFGEEGWPVELVGGDDRYTLSNTPKGALSVASYVHRWRWCTDSGSCYLYSNQFNGTDGISGFSSWGPTRDGRVLPHIAAPGQGMISSLSRDVALDPASTRMIFGRQHWLIQGTSMAAPTVAGSIALLMQQDPTLNYARTLALVQGNADSDGFTLAVPNARWGAGKLDVFGAMARLVSPSSTANREVLAYDDFAGSGSTRINDSLRVAVRFTPTDGTGGLVTGTLFHASTTVNLTEPLQFEVWTDVNGAPGARVGNPVAFPAALAVRHGWSYVDLSAAQATLAGNRDYFLVLSFSKDADNFFLRHDNGTPTGRSVASLNGGPWGTLPYDLRIRPIVASNVVQTDVTGEEGAAEALVLAPTAPNPFTDSAEIRFTVPTTGVATLEVFNVLGQQVAVLFDAPAAAGQSYRLRFDGAGFASGVYVYRLTHAGKTLTRSMTLVR